MAWGVRDQGRSRTPWGVKTRSTRSGSLPVVVAKQPTKPLTALDRPVAVRGARSRFDQAVADPLVISLRVVVADVLAHEVTKVAFAERDHAVEHSRRIEPTKRSANAFKFGDRAGSRTHRTPPCSRISRNSCVKTGSRSWIK